MNLPVGLLTILLLGLFGGASPRDAAAHEAKPAASEDRSPGPLVLEDVPQPFVPKKPLTEAQRDRLHALTLFAAGRVLEQRQDYAGALRRYERAFRYDPRSVTVVRAIVPMAVRLGRSDEAVRYVLKAVELEQGDPVVLEGLGDRLVRQGDFLRAAKLYERALAAGSAGSNANAPNAVLLRCKLAEIYFILGAHKKAADHAAWLVEALEHPKEHGLDEALRKQLLAGPDPMYNMFGRCFLLADRPAEAIAAFNKANRIAPNKGLLGFHLARVHARTGKPEQALAELQAYFDRRLVVEGLAPYELLAEVLAALGKKSELVGRLEKLLANDPGNVPLGYFLAGKYREAGNLQRAEPLYVKLVAKKPLATGYKALVEIYRKTGRPEALLRVLGEVADKTASLEPLGDEVRKLTGDTAFEDTALLDRLIAAARKLVRTAPDRFDCEARLGVALLAREGKRAKAAGEFFESAIRADGDSAAEWLLIWGTGLLVEEKFAEAADVFQRGIDQKALPADDPTFHFYLSAALEMDGRTDEALAAARRAVTLRNDSPRLLGRVAWILFHGERPREAIRAYTELIEKYDADHGSSEVREVLREARLVLANLYVTQGDAARAEEYLEQVLDEFPDDVSAMNDLGFLWAEQDRRLERACRMIRKAVEADSDNVAYRDSLGWVLYRLGRFQEAAAELEKAAASDPSEGEILEHLGDARLKAGQGEKAKDAWRRAAAAYRKADRPERAKQVEAKLKR
jgi:tetratricopeptide (TPR) repeat protein